MKARVGAWTFRIVEVARPGLGSLSFGLSLSLSRTLSIAYRRHGSRISAWRRMRHGGGPYRVRGEARARELPGVRRSRLASSRSPWRWRGGECFNAGVAGSSGAERRRSASGSRHGRTGSGSAVGASGSGWSAPPRVTCCTATYSRRARCHGLNRLGVFRIYIHTDSAQTSRRIYASTRHAAHRALMPIHNAIQPGAGSNASRRIVRYTPSTRLTPHRIESPTHRESRRQSSGP